MSASEQVFGQTTITTRTKVCKCWVWLKGFFFCLQPDSSVKLKVMMSGSLALKQNFIYGFFSFTDSRFAFIRNCHEYIKVTDVIDYGHRSRLNMTVV